MAEEVNSTADQGVDNQSANNQGGGGNSQESQMSHSLKGTLDFLTQGKASEDFRKDFEAFEKENQTENKEDQGQEEVGGEAAAVPGTEKTEPKKPEPKVNEIDTPLFGKQELGKKKSVETPVELKEFSDIQNYVKTNYGAEDVQKFLTESVPKFREQAQKMGDYEKKVNEFTKIFENIPEPLFNAVKSHLEGRSWKEEIDKAPKLDFSKKVDDHDKIKLIDTYFPGKFSKEDFDSEEEGSKKIINIALDAAKRSYEADKTTFDGKLQARLQQENMRQESFVKSVGSSVEKLKKDLPHVNEIALKDVSQLMEEGPQAIMSELFNNDGSYKEDAATKIAMLKHGFKTMETYMKIAANQAETEVNETFVAKAPGKIDNQKPGGSNKMSEALEKGLSVLSGLNRGRTY